MRNKPALNILIIEDSTDNKTSWAEEIKMHNEDNPDYKIKCYYRKRVVPAMKLLLSCATKKIIIDAVVIDRMLPRQNNNKTAEAPQQEGLKEGDKFWNFCRDYLQMPAILYSANLIDADIDASKPNVLPHAAFEKMELKISELIQFIVQYHKLGVLKILSQSGQISSHIRNFFIDHFDITTWEKYSVNNSYLTIQQGIIRFLSAYIQEQSAVNNQTNSVANYFVQETFMPSPSVILSPIATGDIIYRENTPYVIMTPQCDLIKRVDDSYKKKKSADEQVEAKKQAEQNAKAKAEQILLARIIEHPNPKKKVDRYFPLPLDTTKIIGFSNEEEKKKIAIDFQQLVLLSFDDVCLEKEKYQREHNNTSYKIANIFLRDLINQFGRYYGRQGAPEVEEI